VKVGELVIVRLEETGLSRFLVPGLIVNKTETDKVMYDVLTQGKTVQVSDIDLGPIDMFSEKDRLEKKWNDV